MENSIQDAITKEIIVNAPIEKVFNAITNPLQITKWFPNAVEGEIKAGERIVFDFGKSGKAKVYVEAVTPNTYFAYRWIPGSNTHLEPIKGDILDNPHTLVEFRLEEVEDKTKVTLTESGFSKLSPDIYTRVLGENTQGWAFMLSRLEKLTF